MRYFVWFFVAVVLLYTVNLAFATQENPVSTKSRFPESIKIGEKVPFSLKISNIGNYRISDIEPIITIMPKSASEFVHVEINPQISTLWDGFYEIIHGTIYVDNGITVDRIFVSVSFMGKNQFGEQVRLSSDSTFNASIKIEKESPNTDSIFDLENKKPSCTNPNIPLYGCNETITVKIESPLQQFKSGVPSGDIKCKEGLELILKLTNDNPACVKPETKSKLIERGWAKPV